MRRAFLTAICLGLLVGVPGFSGPVGAGTVRGFNPGDAFQDCDICPMMVVVPSGSFMMGSPQDEPERGDNEGPQRQVTISKPFAVGKFEITVDQFRAFVEETGHSTGNKCFTWEQNIWEERQGRSFLKPGFDQVGSQPVVCVNRDDATAYIAWLSTRTGEAYRLLSEAEWEYSARAGTATPFSTGARISTDQANFVGDYTYNGSKKGQYRGKTTAVGSFSANGFGLHDMHGNVWEWVEDCFGDYKTAPIDGSAQVAKSCDRVLRGGSWLYTPRSLRSANRDKLQPDNRDSTIGFRVARTLTP